MSQQLLRNADIEPTTEIITEGLGTSNSIYMKFVEKLEEYGVSLMDWRFYNDGKSWLSKGEYKWTTARGTNKVKPLFWLSIWEGFFKVSFNFKLETREELLKLPTSNEAKEIITNAEVNGKAMKFIPVVFDVNNDNQLDDIFVIMNFRKENI